MRALSGELDHSPARSVPRMQHTRGPSGGTLAVRPGYEAPGRAEGPLSWPDKLFGPVPWCSLAKHAALSRPRTPVRIRSGPPCNPTRWTDCARLWRGGRVRLKATVSKTVMGHWPIESSNLSLSARLACDWALRRHPV